MRVETMRVIAGEFRSRKLKSLAGLDTRPTPDRLRESLFSILQPRIEGSVFIDAYAGTGSVGIEALSRGAAQVLFLECNPAAIRVIDDNLYSLGIGNRGRVVRGRVSGSLRVHGAGATIVFLDPPYECADEYTATLDWLGEHPPRLVIAQHHPKHGLNEAYGQLHRFRAVRQGDNELSFYAPQTTPQIGSCTPEYPAGSGI
jgi:16S rRNA (guanine966-N2)-methyltransferase